MCEPIAPGMRSLYTSALEEAAQTLYEGGGGGGGGGVVSAKQMTRTDNNSESYSLLCPESVGFCRVSNYRPDRDL